MPFDPAIHHRRSLRFPGFDYSQPGGYFVTLVTHQRQCLFGQILDGEMHLNEYGRLVQNEWTSSEKIREEIVLDAFVVMPNHLHAVVFIVGACGRTPLQCGRTPLQSTRTPRLPKYSLGSLIAGFKASATHQINRVRNTPGQPVWQRNYYEHIIRNDRDLNAIRKYILENPIWWSQDIENPL